MGFKEFISRKKEEYKDNREYMAKVKAKVKEARRESYEKQAVISARASAQKKAKLHFNPPAQRQGGGLGTQSEAFKQLMYGNSQVAPKQVQLQKKIVRRNIKKNKRKAPKIKRRIQQVIQKERADSGFNKIFYEN